MTCCKQNTLATAATPVEGYVRLADDYIDRIPTYNTTDFSGDGVVIPAGGRYVTSAYVNVKLLRRLGWNGIIQIWNLGDVEWDDVLTKIFVDLGCEVHSTTAPRGGWELKAYAALHSSLQRVLLLDADSYIVKNPEVVFSKNLAAWFTPDSGKLSPDSWKCFDLEYRDEPAFESGQFFVDKSKCWEPLNLAWHYNQQSDYYYNKCGLYGDKDTFHLAWRKLGFDYSMSKYAPGFITHSMIQYDFENNRLWQHRVNDKWNRGAKGNNPNTRLMHEERCWRWALEFERVWDGELHNTDTTYNHLLIGKNLDGECFNDDNSVGPSRWRVHRRGSDHVCYVVRDARVVLKLVHSGVHWVGQRNNKPIILGG